MNIVYQKKLNYQRFLESDFMKNKKFYQAVKINLNDNDFCMYIINENKEENKKKKRRSCLTKQKTKQEPNYKKGKTKKSILLETFTENILNENSNQEEEITENEHNEKNQNVKNLIEDNFSQSSALTKSSLSSFWNINKIQTKDIQNNFTSKKFFKLQILLVIFFIILLTGYFLIHKNTIMTIKNQDKKERIIGFGSKN